MKFWKKINDFLFVIKEEELEDFRAVLSSKVSRRIDLELASNLDHNKVKDFLLRNLCNYGHASIAEMSFPTIFIKNTGWVSNWIIEDDKLFLGQEVSTRAVFKNILNICRECKSNNDITNDFNYFKNIFLHLKEKYLNKNIKSYKFDYIRWALPGAFSSGIILNINSRVLNRIINRLKGLTWFDQNIVNDISKGFQKCSPLVYKSLKHKNINHSFLWDRIEVYKIDSVDIIKNDPVQLDFSNFYIDKKDLKYIDLTKKQYIDKYTDYLGKIKIKIYCSLAAARDWHRHRSLMPWKLSLVVNHKRMPFISSLYNTSYFVTKINNFFKNHIINSDFIEYKDLYKFPMGTVCCIEGIGTISKIVYTLKLRSESDNANFEYKYQALKGLQALKKFLNNINK